MVVLPQPQVQVKKVDGTRHRIDCWHYLLHESSIGDVKHRLHALVRWVVCAELHRRIKVLHLCQVLRRCAGVKDDVVGGGGGEAGGGEDAEARQAARPVVVPPPPPAVAVVGVASAVAVVVAAVAAAVGVAPHTRTVAVAWAMQMSTGRACSRPTPARSCS